MVDRWAKTCSFDSNLENLTGAVPAGEVAALAHEVGDDAVEGGALEVKGLAGLSRSLLAGAEASEVLRRARHHVAAELHSRQGWRRERAARWEGGGGGTSTQVLGKLI